MKILVILLLIHIIMLITQEILDIIIHKDKSWNVLKKLSSILTNSKEITIILKNLKDVRLLFLIYLQKDQHAAKNHLEKNHVERKFLDG